MPSSVQVVIQGTCLQPSCPSRSASTTSLPCDARRAESRRHRDRQRWRLPSSFGQCARLNHCPTGPRSDAPDRVSAADAEVFDQLSGQGVLLLRFLGAFWWPQESAIKLRLGSRRNSLGGADIAGACRSRIFSRTAISPQRGCCSGKPPRPGAPMRP